MWTGLIRRFSTEDTQVDAEQQHGRDGERGKDGVNGVFTPAGRKTGTVSPFRPPPLEPLILHGYRESTQSSARLLTPVVAEEIRAMIPERLRIAEDWHLVYSLEQDGASLSTLYQKCRHYEGRRAGFVLVVRDQEGGVSLSVCSSGAFDIRLWLGSGGVCSHIRTRTRARAHQRCSSSQPWANKVFLQTFGAYLSEYPRPAPSYFGNGECFLWRASTLASLPLPPSADAANLSRSTTLAPRVPPGSGTCTPSDSIRFKAFPYSGLNDCYINCENGFLSVGSGGGHYGLWLDDSLDIGHSSQCDTFGNEPLSDAGEKFGVWGVEIWALGA